MIQGFSLLRRRALLGALACSAAVGLAIPTTAAAKVTSLTSCQAIRSPGKYRLDANVSTSSVLCFEITANDVTLNLNSHTITGNSEAFGILVLGGSGAKITGPGTVTGFAVGIYVNGVNGSVGGVTATENSFEGIDLESPGNIVKGNVTTGNSFGIFVDGGASGNTIIGNYSHGNSTYDLVDFNFNCHSNVWRATTSGPPTSPAFTAA